MLKFWVHIPQKGMIEISIERDKITKSLNELENEFKNGNIPKTHYEFQKRQLTEKLETLAVAERVMRLQGKETVESPVETHDESENDELFKKYITSPGLKEKNIGNKNKKRISQNTMIASALLIVAFVVGIGFGIYPLNIPEEVSSVSLSTNDSAFPPFVLNNTTNMTNTTNSTKQMLNTTKTVNTTVTKPAPTKPTVNTTPTTPVNNSDEKKAAGDPGNQKTVTTNNKT
jgi:hypothetical protein